MKRSGRVDLDRLEIRVDGLRGRIPVAGMTLAAFEALALADVSPPEVLKVVRSLHNRRTLFVRQNRGDVRIFSERPAKIAGVFEGSAPADILISSAGPHMRRLASALTVRDAAKVSGEAVSANAARDALDVSAARLVALVRKHMAQGVSLVEVREAFWSVFAPHVVGFIAIFEPALARDATCGLTPSPARRRRIENGLCATGKVAALIEKARDDGIYRSELYQGVSPKLPAAQLGIILDALLAEGRIEARQIRVRGSRFATRFFGVEQAA